MSEVPPIIKDDLQFRSPGDDEELKKRLNAIFGEPQLQIPSPRVRLSIDATTSTPVLAAMIARVLTNAGATVTAGNGVNAMSIDPEFRLDGLHIHIGQLTWVREEEADRWGKQP